MPEIMNNIVNIIFSVLGTAIMVGLLLKLKRNRINKKSLAEGTERGVKTVYGELIDKQFVMKRIQSLSEAPKNKAECILTFKCGDEKLFFSVSEVFFDNYKKNQKGYITYKGETLIDFKGDVKIVRTAKRRESREE